MKTTITAALTFGACAALRRKLRDAPRRDGTWVCLRPAENRGAAFGLPVDPAALPALSAMSLALLLPSRRKHPVGTGLILGGGLSNLWERIRWGGVLDYLRFPQAPGRTKNYLFNLADFAIFTGALSYLRPPC